MGRCRERIGCCHGDATSAQLDRHAIGPLVLAERHPKQIRTQVVHDSNSRERLDDVANADGVIVGSGLLTRDIVKDAGIMGRINVDPKCQLIGAQCSGALILAKLGLLRDVPACTDLITKPWVEEAGVSVLNQTFFASGNVATAGGCLASQYSGVEGHPDSGHNL